MMSKLTDHFSRHEFQCPCGCGFSAADIELLLILEQLRIYINSPIRITSACRCEEYNSRLGGSKTSYHVIAMAADITSNITPSELYEIINQFYPEKYGIGKYDRHVHIDIRDKKARWHGKSK